jgi:hypothetical protein
MTAYTFNPLEDERWREFVEGHARSTAFHTHGWIEALHRTYGFEPVVYSTSGPGVPLSNGIVLCRIRSSLTGRRMVSLPFSDHCDPLVDAHRDLVHLIDALYESTDVWNYVELRPTDANLVGDARFEPSGSFRLHSCDLRASLDDLFRQTHISTVQRKVRRAAREGLTYEEGRSEPLLKAFYRLMIVTRRRHGVPPQPIEWFRNLMNCLGDSLKIRIALVNGKAIGSIMTLQHRGTLVYKYGCSDARFHRLGTMPFLFWRSILDAKARGLHTLDLGRTDLSNAGLIAFKERMDAVSSPLTYLRCSTRPQRVSRGQRLLRRMNYLVARLPDPLFVTAGRLIYPHVA